MSPLLLRAPAEAFAAQEHKSMDQCEEALPRVPLRSLRMTHVRVLEQTAAMGMSYRLQCQVPGNQSEHWTLGLSYPFYIQVESCIAKLQRP